MSGPQPRTTDPMLTHGIRQLGRADEGSLTSTVLQLRRMLAQRGSSFDALADALERIGLERDVELDIANVSYLSLRRYFDRFARDIPLSAHPWVGDLLRRLHAGATPTIQDRQRLTDMVARVRMAGRLPG